jgi:hypothetical protein
MVPATPCRRRPQVEPLEDRTVPAALQIVGTGGVGYQAVAGATVDQFATAAAASKGFDFFAPADTTGVTQGRTFGGLEWHPEASSFNLVGNLDSNTVPPGLLSMAVTGGTLPDVSAQNYGDPLQVKIVPTLPGETTGQLVTVEVQGFVDASAGHPSGSASFDYGLSYTYGGKSNTVVSGTVDPLQYSSSTFSDQGDELFTAKIGDTFSLGFSYRLQGQLGQASDRVSTDTVSGGLAGGVNLRSHPQPDLVADSLTWHPDSSEGGGVDLQYEVRNADLPDNADVALYWADAPDLEHATHTQLAWSQPAATKAQDNPYSVHVTADDLKNIPTDWHPSYLVLALDPPANPHDPQDAGKIAEQNETNNEQSLAVDAPALIAPFVTPSQGLVRPVTVDVSGSLIKATFKPVGGALRLDQTAQLLGVDHFNWVQRIVEKPESWIIEREYPGTDRQLDVLAPGGEGQSAINPGLIDPDTVPGAQVVIFYPDDTKSVVHPEGIDTQPFYLLDPPDLEGVSPTGFSLPFKDAPRFRAFAPGESVGFETQLVGVKTDGTYAGWGGTQSKFAWRTNATTAGGGVIDAPTYLRAMQADGAPPVASGGVFDVRIDGGPVINPAPGGGQGAGGGGSSVPAPPTSPPASPNPPAEPGPQTPEPVPAGRAKLPLLQPDAAVAVGATQTRVTAKRLRRHGVRLQGVVSGVPGQEPAGEVRFFDGRTFLGSAPLVNGIATLRKRLLPGRHHVLAVFVGDPIEGSSRAKVSFRVVP